MTINPRPLVIYHGNCADGFGAAWCFHHRFGTEVDFHVGVYQTPPPDVTGRIVVLVDFSYKRDVMVELARSAAGVLVLDHHASAEKDLTHDHATRPDGPTLMRCDGWLDRAILAQRGDGWGNFLSCIQMDRNEGLPWTSIYAAFDLNRSGAGIAWDFLFNGKSRPQLINHIEDRDIWKFAIPGTREIQAALFSYPYDFGLWDGLMMIDTLALFQEGAGIERKHHKDIAELVKVCQRRMVIGGFDVPVASLPYTLTSDAGHLMAKDQPFAACYWDTEKTRIFSLRSQDDGADVSVIAQQYGGGGHVHAAGFAVPRDHELAKA
jgi:hypothetical protein